MCLILTRPRKSVVICENFTNFVTPWVVCPWRYIFDESVFAFILNEKSDSFKQDEDNDSTHFLYSYVAMHTFVRTPHTIQVWGLVIVYSSWVLSEPLVR